MKLLVLTLGFLAVAQSANLAHGGGGGHDADWTCYYEDQHGNKFVNKVGGEGKIPQDKLVKIGKSKKVEFRCTKLFYAFTDILNAKKGTPYYKQGLKACGSADAYIKEVPMIGSKGGMGYEIKGNLHSGAGHDIKEAIKIVAYYDSGIGGAEIVSNMKCEECEEENNI